MEKHKAVNFVRLLSDESVQSSLSSDSCEYYQTEIFDQLPSIQASRPNQSSHVEPCETSQGGPEPKEQLSHGHLSRGSKDKTSLQPLRNLPVCMQGKRTARDRRNMQISNIGFWESWRRSQSISRRRVSAHISESLSGLVPWRHTLHTIEGRFGVGVKAYFVFLRYLVYLNLLHCTLICGFILGPTAFYGRSKNSEPLRYGGNDSVLDFVLGKGYLDRSPVFYGFYTRGSLNLQCLNTPLLYFTGIITILFISLIMVVRRTTRGYKHTWMLGKRHSMNVSYKIFCGWDFTIQDPDAATLNRNFIRNDLKLFLEEQSFSLRAAQRTIGQKDDYYWLVKLVLQYLPPITITTVDLVLPVIFRKISSFEDYSFTTQVNVTLVRTIFLKLSSLGIYLFFIFTTTYQQRCWENHFGREMYKLCIFNFLATFCNAFLWNYPRKLVQEKHPSSCVARLMGKKHFLIPFNVLDRVYSQTVSWVGVYYCPLLPLIGTVTLVATFYIQKFTVLRCCVAEQRMFRASSSSVLFHFMLLLGLFMAAATLGFDLYNHVVTEDVMGACGPFQNMETIYNVTGVCVNSLPISARKTIGYLTSEAFALPLLVFEIIILTSYVSRGRANQRAIERLKDMLVMCSSDKRFLVKQHATMLRRRHIRPGCSTAPVEDTHLSPQKHAPPCTSTG
ncbi:transmembrane channel-like protein 8 isoform X2 [Parambassis ranga]|uniref:Transmembrane channel-like protein n=1 Tax=Parambassis ranga TaxID=210632 RepID=A0A6P7I8N0_9TELE|nr:transmembrane channel-like protein 8 isoform X2 [Parambassis ranga]